MRRGVLILLISSVAACGVTGPGTVTLRFEGTVTAQATGQPIAGAEILLVAPVFLGGTEETRARTTTDSQGRYSLTQRVDDNCVGQFFGLDVRAKAPGFASDAKNVAQCNGTLQRFDFALAPASSP